MDHQTSARLICHCPSCSHRLMGIPGSYRVEMHAHLNTKAKTGIVLDRIRSGIHVNHTHVM